MPHTYLLIFKQLRNKKNKNCPLLIQSVSRFDTLTLRKERNKIYRDASFFLQLFCSKRTFICDCYFGNKISALIIIYYCDNNVKVKSVDNDATIYIIEII